MGAFSLSQLQTLMPDLRTELDPEAAFGPVIDADRRLRDRGGKDLAVAIDFFERFYMTDDILVKVDRASMMHSLEVRTPFLDTRLAEYVNALPDSLKLHGSTTKYLLKQAMLGQNGQPSLLPGEIITRKKKGFGIPVARWIRHELADFFRQHLVDEWPGELLPMIDHGEVCRLHLAHVQRRENHYKELWALLMLVLWAENRLCSVVR